MSPKSSYKDHPDPNLLTRDVLIWIDEQGAGDFTAIDVANQFGVTNNDATHRLSRLYRWGCLALIRRGQGQAPSLYQTTPWGRKMAEKWKEEQAKGEDVPDNKEGPDEAD